MLGPAALGIAVIRFDFNRHTQSRVGVSDKDPEPRPPLRRIGFALGQELG